MQLWSSVLLSLAIIKLLLVIKLLIPLWPRKPGTMFADNSQMGTESANTNLLQLSETSGGNAAGVGGFRDVSNIYLLHFESASKNIPRALDFRLKMF